MTREQSEKMTFCCEIPEKVKVMMNEQARRVASAIKRNPSGSNHDIALINNMCQWIFAEGFYEGRKCNDTLISTLSV